MTLDPKDSDDVLAFDSDEKITLWQAGAKVFVQAIGSRLLVVNRVFWAQTSTDGVETASSDSVDRANANLQYMYDELFALDRKSTEVAVIDYPPDLVVTDREHKWGNLHFISHWITVSI